MFVLVFLCSCFPGVCVGFVLVLCGVRDLVGFVRVGVV